MFRNIYIYNTHVYIYIHIHIYMFNSLLNSLLHSLQLPGVRSGLSKVRTKVVKFCLRLATANNGIPWHTMAYRFFHTPKARKKSHDLVPVRIPNRNLRVRTSLLKLASNDVKAGCGAESGHWYLKGGSEVRADAKRPELRGFSQQIRIHFPRSGAFIYIYIDIL